MEMGQLNNGYGQAAATFRPNDPMAVLNEAKDINLGVDSIKQNFRRLQMLQRTSLDDPDASGNTQTNRQLDALSSETMTLCRAFTSRVQKLKSMQGAGLPNNAAQVGSVERKLKEAMQEYQTLDADFRKQLREQMARQYRIVRPDASEAEVREACEDTTSTQVFSQAVCYRRYRSNIVD